MKKQFDESNNQTKHAGTTRFSLLTSLLHAWMHYVIAMQLADLLFVYNTLFLVDSVFQKPAVSSNYCYIQAQGLLAAGWFFHNNLLNNQKFQTYNCCPLKAESVFYQHIRPSIPSPHPALPTPFPNVCVRFLKQMNVSHYWIKGAWWQTSAKIGATPSPAPVDFSLIKRRKTRS